MKLFGNFCEGFGDAGTAVRGRGFHTPSSVIDKSAKCNSNLISFILVISLIASQLIVKIVTFIINTI